MNNTEMTVELLFEAIASVALKQKYDIPERKYLIKRLLEIADE